MKIIINILSFQLIQHSSMNKKLVEIDAIKKIPLKELCMLWSFVTVLNFMAIV